VVESSGLLNRLSRLCKIHNLKQILLPAKDLQRFGSHLISPDFTQFDAGIVTKQWQLSWLSVYWANCHTGFDVRGELRRNQSHPEPYRIQSTGFTTSF
jgi:hypothetical protein